jgi:hypothetical protein
MNRIFEMHEKDQPLHKICHHLNYQRSRYSFALLNMGLSINHIRNQQA